VWECSKRRSMEHWHQFEFVHVGSERVLAQKADVMALILETP
jgi:hypothetical protein